MLMLTGFLVAGCASTSGLSSAPPAAVSVPHTSLAKGIMQQPDVITGQEHFLWCASCPKRTLKFAASMSKKKALLKAVSGKALPIIIRFKYASAHIGNASISMLDNLIMKVVPGSVITISGYTDSSGSKSYNRRLARIRAEAVRDWLASHIKYHVTYKIRARGKCCYARQPGLSPENRRVEVNIKGGRKR